MKRILIALVLLVALITVGYSQDLSEISDISFLSTTTSQENTPLILAGQYIIVGYNITDQGVNLVELALEFGSPEEGKVKVIKQKNSYTVYDFIVHSSQNRLSMGGQNYFYTRYNKDVILLIEFPYLYDKNLYGYYQVYYLVSYGIYTEELISELLKSYNNFFTPESN
jgi:hypothetical protein